MSEKTPVKPDSLAKITYPDATAMLQTWGDNYDPSKMKSIGIIDGEPIYLVVLDEMTPKRSLILYRGSPNMLASLVLKMRGYGLEPEFTDDRFE